jgi:hypothetical protein
VGKIASSRDGLLQHRPEPAVGPLEVVPLEAAEDLLDKGDQGLLVGEGGGDSLTSLSETPHKNSKMEYTHLSLRPEPPFPIRSGDLPRPAQGASWRPDLAPVLLGALNSLWISLGTFHSLLWFQKLTF